MAGPRFALPLFALLVGAGAAQAADAESAGAAARAARYYAFGLQAPLLEIRAGAQIVAACHRRFRAQCSGQHREAGDRARLALEYLDALTLFPERSPANPAANLKKYADVVAALDATHESILHAALEYDRALFARYGAALNACPPGNPAEYRQSLELLELLDLRMFGVNLYEHATVLMAITDEESRLGATFNEMVPAQDCVATRQLGELLLTMLAAKLAPWSGEPKDAPDADATRAIAHEFLFQAATELELIVNPESRGKFDAFAQRLNTGEPAPKKPGISLRW